MNELNEIVEAIVSKLNNNTLSLDDAKSLISKCEEKAKSINVPVTIAVVDIGGNLIAQHRMDNAILASINLSKAKAFTALSLQTDTHRLAEEIQTGKSLYGLQHTKTDYCFLGGGFPILRGVHTIGAIGVSGGAVEEDIIIGKSIF